MPATYRVCAKNTSDIKKTSCFRSVLIRMFTNFGRELVFSADLCYNEAIEKPPSEREVARVA